MHWFRSRMRSCGRLALFALALQMVLSFGHMHRDDLGLPPLPGTDSNDCIRYGARLAASEPTPSSRVG